MGNKTGWVVFTFSKADPIGALPNAQPLEAVAQEVRQLQGVNGAEATKRTLTVFFREESTTTTRVEQFARKRLLRLGKFETARSA